MHQSSRQASPAVNAFATAIAAYWKPPDDQRRRSCKPASRLHGAARINNDHTLRADDCGM